MNSTKKILHKEIFLACIFLSHFAAICSAEATYYEQQSDVCGHTHYSAPQGRISSPHYPFPYPNYTSCTWVITTSAQHPLNIRVTDLDIEDDANCKHPPCCVSNWLSIPRAGGGAKQKLCGKLTHSVMVTLRQPQAVIKFHSSAVHKEGRGFLIVYNTYDYYEDCMHCTDGRCVQDLTVCSMFSCSGKPGAPCMGDSYGCFNETQRCNGELDCQSGRDEENCPRHKCSSDERPCRSGQGCYTFEQVCDSKSDCADNTDETNCDDTCIGRHKCSDGRGCYSSVERCDGVHNCMDNSDEENCYRRFQCDDGNYIPHSEWCDGQENCKDGSDEQGCIKNSVIAAAIMGSLLCSLLLVIAVGCMCRLYSLRLAVTNSYRIHHNSGSFSTQPPVPHLDEEFFNREPPPAYSVAVSGCPLQCAATQPNSRLFGNEHSMMQRHQHLNSRRMSRRHSNRRRSQRNIMVTVPPHCDPNVTLGLQSQTVTPNYAGLTSSQLPVLTQSSGAVSGANDPVLVQQGEAILPAENTNNKLNNTVSGVPQPAALVPNQVAENLPPHALYETCILNIPVVQTPARTVSPSHSCITSASESPSRNSVTSSTSLLSYLSGDEDEQLLVVPAS
ncbi:low-density lipoprotein receptor-related protein 3-like isoform X1 [Schistocerca cancellata]|uniref:low-density lipoprotein receptor-related protein 3-like isoform X1 n=1 Tax=Schistocerca cancellata TaxID=274614 RepID=UPI002117D4A7|nr:low-density lipoprotein receptor-related protein 3-like isoform X1 [Schistocerca cancellata]XP_049762228.1 low-density lipoprotein receptor-related protein 3-like isoform X1 [Schistocerca cancellata]